MDGHRMRVFATEYHPLNPHVFLSGGWDNAVMVCSCCLALHQKNSYKNRDLQYFLTYFVLLQSVAMFRGVVIMMMYDVGLE